ncbi:hypothetical protein SLEP1_g59213 [Rubroshorea leprosula]|uniref:Uncharacterized protein n=1 Tax=Rubroshorea leprosula TaxID=152421 RepID=A0AAV5MSW6_9ROSI|nr:hypothetical protein SLEP1_g59213 [Rubroshorea leprosula]
MVFVLRPGETTPSFPCSQAFQYPFKPQEKSFVGMQAWKEGLPVEASHLVR